MREFIVRNAIRTIQFSQIHSAVIPSAGVLVKMSAGKALVSASSFQNLPGFLCTAHLDPGKVCGDERKEELSTPRFDEI